MFGLKKKSKQSVRKLDRILTGIVLGGVVAGVFGYSRRKKKKAGEKDNDS